MTQKIKPKYRIGNFTATFMVGTAVLFWAIQFLLSLTGIGEIVSEIVGFIQNILFFFWFLFAGINFFGKNSLQKWGVTMGLDVVELIPFINDFPAMIAEVLWLIFISRKEDTEKATAEAAAAEKAAEEQALAMQQYYQTLAAQQAANAEAELRSAA